MEGWETGKFPRSPKRRREIPLACTNKRTAVWPSFLFVTPLRIRARSSKSFNTTLFMRYYTWTPNKEGMYHASACCYRGVRHPDTWLSRSWTFFVGWTLLSSNRTQFWWRMLHVFASFIFASLMLTLTIMSPEPMYLVSILSFACAVIGCKITPSARRAA